MSKKSAFLITLVLIAAMTVPAYAAVENVKLSGDITIRGFYRDNYTLGDLETSTFNGSAFTGNDEQRFFMSTVRIRVDADLSQNISAQVELLNQRDIDPPTPGTQGSPLTASTVIAGVAPSAANDQFDVILSLANITIKELYYPELTVRVGRQNIQFGEGFVVGNRHLLNTDPSNTISADEFTAFNSFDAIRVMVQKGVWHFDAFAAKISENSIEAGDDHNLFGLNIGRTFDSYDAEAEIYTVISRSGAPTNVFGDISTETQVVTAHGIRGSLRPWDRLKLNGEAVFQWGEEGGANQGALPGAGGIGAGTSAFTPNGRERQNIVAWALDLRAEWDWIEAPWPTTLGIEWVYYSGEDDSEASNSSNNYRLLYRGKFHSAIREFQGFYYLTDVGATPGHFNQHQVMFDAAFHPFNNPDLTLFTRWLLYWFDEVPIAGRGKFIGNELDSVLTYDYTEDLKFTLIGALFFPGDYFETDKATPNQFGLSSSQAENTAKELVAEIALTF